MSLMGYMAQNYWRTGENPRRMGTAHPAMSPYQAFETADGYLMLGVGNDAQWRRFCVVASLGSMAEDPRFDSNENRVNNFLQTVEMVAGVMRTRPTSQWIADLRAAGVACSPIHTLDQALAHPQLAARELVVQSEHPVLGTVLNMGLPVRFNGGARAAVRPAPLLGEHTTEVLSEVGIPPAEQARLFASGVTGTRHLAA
jgi:formyl-CoA transferase